MNTNYIAFMIATWHFNGTEYVIYLYSGLKINSLFNERTFMKRCGMRKFVTFMYLKTCLQTVNSCIFTATS